ncbi:hypothetical protein, partial [Burkholderia sp. 3C]
SKARVSAASSPFRPSANRFPPRFPIARKLTLPGLRAYPNAKKYRLAVLFSVVTARRRGYFSSIARPLDAPRESKQNEATRTSKYRRHGGAGRHDDEGDPG